MYLFFIFQAHDWSVIQKIYSCGENFTLFCHIENCCEYSSGWEMFNPQRNSLYLDVRPIHPNHTAKYDPTTSREGFSLTIRNETKNDLNIHYTCKYRFNEIYPKLLSEQLAFFGKIVIHNMKMKKYGANVRKTALSHVNNKENLQI